MNNYKIDEEFDLFIEDIGETHSCLKADERVIELYSDILPNQLFKYWEKLGWCGYGNGIFWMTNPKAYQQLLDNWLKSTSFSKRKDLSVIGRTAFGELEVWAKGRGAVLSINPILGTITLFSRIYKKSLSREEENKQMRYFWGGQELEFIDYKDESNQPLFERTLKKLGSLKSDEMYGLKHARMLGGSITLDNLDIMKIDAYHDIARQMDDPEIIVI